MIKYELRLRDAIINGLIVFFKYYEIRDVSHAIRMSQAGRNNYLYVQQNLIKTFRIGKG